MSEQDNETKLLTDKILDGSISDEEFKTLGTLIKAKKKATEDRAAAITAAKLNLSTLGIKIHDIYSRDEIILAAAVYVEKSTRKSVETKRGSILAKSTGKASAGPVLIQYKAPGARGRPVEWKKGQSKPAFVAKGFADLGKLPNVEQAFAEHFTKEGKTWFATEEGKKELADVVAFAKTGKVKASA